MTTTKKEVSIALCPELCYHGDRFLYILGRILNRFSKDIGQLDEILPITMYDFLTVSACWDTSTVIDIGAMLFDVISWRGLTGHCKTRLCVMSFCKKSHNLY